MGLLWVVCMGLLVAAVRPQELQNNCIDNTSPPLTVGSTEDAASLATSLECSNGDAFTVEWVGEVVVAETIRVTGGSSLNVAGTGPGAIADGQEFTQLFVVDQGSRLHLSDIIVTNGNASAGGAIFANQSSVSFSGNVSFISNSAHEGGGAIYALESTVSWEGRGMEFVFNSASPWDTYSSFGGAIFARYSAVSWDGDSTIFSSNSAGSGGAIYVGISSNVSWNGDGTQFVSNWASREGGAICAGEHTDTTEGAESTSSVSWGGDGTQFRFNSAGISGGGAINAVHSSTLSWEGNGTEFSFNSAGSGFGGAINGAYLTMSWVGGGTQFNHNIAYVGGAINAYESTVSWDGDGSQFKNNSAKSSGGAINMVETNMSWHGDDTKFISNRAGLEEEDARFGGGGAIYVTVYTSGLSSGSFNYTSTVFWDGDRTHFVNNSGGSGGAISAAVIETSASEPETETILVSWDGDGTEFVSNSAELGGGAIYAESGTGTIAVFWDGDETLFLNNSAAGGGAIYAYGSSVSWEGYDTLLMNNFAYEADGGAIYAHESNVSWDGNGTVFQNNSADEGNGGSIFSESSSKVSWYGDDTEHNYNSAGRDGGAIYVLFSDLSWGGTTVFRGNMAGEGGGALAIVEFGEDQTEESTFADATFIENRATDGGALYSSNVFALHFLNATFHANSAVADGGAVAAYETGSEAYPITFSSSVFSENRATGNGGAVETVSGRHMFRFCDFEGNSAGETKQTEGFQGCFTFPKLALSRPSVNKTHLETTSRCQMSAEP